jgi:hypothetical protein
MYGLLLILVRTYRQEDDSIASLWPLQTKCSPRRVHQYSSFQTFGDDEEQAQKKAH